MSVLSLPPAPRGSTAEQLSRQYAYLFQMAQQINLALEGLEQGAAGTAAAPAAAQASAAVPSAPAVSEELKQQYDNLKSLILRTADEIRAEMDRVKWQLQSEYVAVSEFGTYLEQLNSTIEADAAAITQYYKFFSDLQTNVDAVSAAFERYRVDTEGYIRTGIVSYDGAVPVYGVAVGQDLAVSEVDGERVVEQKNFRATFTASKLSFWQDAVEVAYVSNNRLYIGGITVLQGVTLGRWEISDRSGLAFQWIGG